MPTNGSAGIVSPKSGAVSTLKKECSNAVYYPYYNHMLNDVLVKSSKMLFIRNTIETLKKIIAFFNAPAKRQMVLNNISAKN